MASTQLPSLLALAHIKTPTQAAQKRFFEIFPPLVAHSKDKEPDTLSYYFFTSTKEDDTSIVGFETYPNVDALVNVHSKSPPFEAQSAIIEREKLCDVDVNQFSPVAGFILRPGQKEAPVELIIINEYSNTVEEKFKQFASKLESEGDKGVPTFVVMKNSQSGNIWTFGRYAAKKDYTDKVAEFESQADIKQAAVKSSEYVEAGVGFLLK